MTNHEAHDLAQRIVGRWRGTPPLATWLTTLEPVPHQPALAAFSYFVKTMQDPGPSISQFLERAGMDIPPPHATGPIRHLTRQQRIDILTRNGAPLHLLQPTPSTD